MTRDVVSVDITDSAQEAARLMKEHATGDVVVTDSGRVAGILTDRDLAVRLVAEGRDSMTRVGELVLENVVTCPPDTALATPCARCATTTYGGSRWSRASARSGSSASATSH